MSKAVKENRYSWAEVDEQNPCPICNKLTWCGVDTVNKKARCKRVKEGSYKTFIMKDGTDSYYHDLSKGVRKTKLESFNAKPKKKKKRDLEFWYEYLEQTLKSPNLELLSVKLGLTVDALASVYTGFNGDEWTNPERDGNGVIVGFKRRFKDGSKKSVWGSSPGITTQKGWVKRGDRVFIVEGATDVAAGYDLGVAAIGRPSNVSGHEYIWRALDSCSKPITILGENDFRYSEKCGGCENCQICWPGKYGARKLYKDLTASFYRSKRIQVVMPPSGIKDLRDCLNQGISYEDLLKECEVLDYVK